MDKSGSQATTQNTWNKLTGFVVRPGYPDTVISDSTLVMNAPGVGDIAFSGTVQLTGDVQQFRVVRNGSEVLGSPANQDAIGTVPGVSVSAGDTLELQYQTNSLFTQRRNVTGGYLTFDQTTQDHPASGSPEIGWFTQTAAEVERHVGAEADIGWSATAGLGLDNTIDAPADIGWSVDADFYHGGEKFLGAAPVIGWSAEAETAHGVARYFDVETDIGWAVEAELEHIRKVEPPGVLWETTTVSIHTRDGRVLGALLCNGLEGIIWGRERLEVSTCDITALTQADPELMEDIRPWVHWVTVWYSDRPVWSGPIQKATLGRTLTTITAKDPSTFMWRTRVPVTRTWADTDPTSIADSAVRSMNELHQLTAAPVVIPAVSQAFTYSATADSRMMHQMFDDLVKLGLEWTVHAGRFILGPFTREPIAELYECDFLVEIQRLRDGTATFNDVRVQGQNWAQTATAPLAGLRLQTLVSLDDVFGVSNIQRAAQLYAEDVASIRDVLVIPSGASLHPEADIDLDDLIPGRVVRVNAAGVSNLMMIDQMQVSATPASFDVTLTLISMENKTELAELA
ncbi:hypothetical protein [Rhodococcus sp. SMB37]|uniref:hypothetical protein n=1 Tax=Rhodococcus sp. SMB37 TaxID=2512213 RepID=UPI001F53F27A|nr:hypothetical protein [Rhodococcus sp. SMB37]